LAADVVGTVRSLGSRQAVLIGQGWGGYVGWTATAAHPDVVQALCTVSAPHPREMLRPSGILRRTPLLHLAAMQVPWLPERSIMRRSYLDGHLRAWASPASGYPSAAAVERYRQALSDWPSPHCALEYHRWLVRSRLRADGRAFNRTVSRTLRSPVLAIRGADDRVVTAASTAASSRWVDAAFEHAEIEGAGHFAAEEQPEQVTATLLRWLESLTPRLRPEQAGHSPRARQPATP
jgi:pimeloyl-ACP methyl ester carboxylesterase